MKSNAMQIVEMMHILSLEKHFAWHGNMQQMWRAPKLLDRLKCEFKMKAMER
jgi:hypothetical protein